MKKFTSFIFFMLNLSHKCDAFDKFMPLNFNKLSVSNFDINNVNDISKDSNIDYNLISDVKYDQVENSLNIKDVDNFVNINDLQNNIDNNLLSVDQETFLNELSNNKKFGKFIVNSISSMLPKVDSIGHNVLHANNIFIADILGSEFIPEHLKRDIVLASIKLAIYGDNLGSHLLEFYYKIVDACL